MTPDERQLLSGLFDRMNGAANQPRDREAEAFIADRVRQQPYSPYLLAQTVIVQEQALRAAAERLQQLEAQAQQPAPAEETSFLGSIGKSIFGTGGGSVPSTGAARPSYTPSGYAPAPQTQQGGPWNQGNANYGAAPAGYAAAPQGGGFLKGALGAAAGVAGGVLLADSLRGLFGGHNNPFGIASGGMGGFGQPGGETIVNNYYDGANPDGGGVDQTSAAADAQQDFLQDQSDDFSGDSGGSDDSYNT